MLDRVLMYLRAQERTKTTLEVLCKNHKKHAVTKKKYVRNPELNHQSHHACNNYTQHDISD
jgi:hypothetical protein